MRSLPVLFGLLLWYPATASAAETTRLAFVTEYVRELGVNEVFWGVAMRPGKPLAFGVRGSTLVFGLPGNPVSSLVGSSSVLPNTKYQYPNTARQLKHSSINP